MTNLIDKTAAMLARIAGALAMLAVALVFLHIVYEMVLRNVFDSSTFALDEFVGYGVSTMTFLALGISYRSDALLRVDLLYDRLGPAGRRWLERIADFAAFCVASLLLWYMARTVLRSFERGTVSASIAQVPQWIPEAAVLFGILVFWLCVLSNMLVRFAQRKVST